MDIKTTACNICGRLKRETNHWIKVYSGPGSDGLLMAPVDATPAIDPNGFIVEDVCGEECMTVRVSRWFAQMRAAQLNAANAATTVNSDR